MNIFKKLIRKFNIEHQVIMIFLGKNYLLLKNSKDFYKFDIKERHYILQWLNYQSEIGYSKLISEIEEIIVELLNYKETHINADITSSIIDSIKNKNKSLVLKI